MTNLNLKKISYTLIFLTLLILLLYFYKKEAKTEVIFFYPQNCLGSFINPEKAQGEPEVNNPDLINESNSAVYLGGFKEIYCGNFQGPVNEGEIQNITLKFNMVLTDERKEAPIIETTSPKSLIEKIIPSRTIEIINTSTDNTQTDTNEIQKATEEINTDKTETNKETTTTPENSPTTETPQSFFYKLVFAQETQPTANETQNAANSTQTAADETRTNVNDNNSELMRTDGNEVRTSSQEGSYEFASDSTTTTSDEIQSSTTSTTSTETTTSTSETSTTSAPQIFNYFDVFYTLDGVNWQYLGSITNQNWQNISFSIPVNDWLTVSKIQIKLQSNPALENIPYLYLESMNLEVEYNLGKNDNLYPQDISPDCLEFKTKLNQLNSNLIKPAISAENGVTSSENNLISTSSENISTSTALEETSTSTLSEETFSLITENNFAENIKGYLFKTKGDYEFWIINENFGICKKLTNLNTQNLPTGMYGDIFFYLDSNGVLNGYNIVNNTTFSITFENNMEIPLTDTKKLKINLDNNSLKFTEIEIKNDEGIYY